MAHKNTLVLNHSWSSCKATDPYQPVATEDMLPASSQNQQAHYEQTKDRTANSPRALVAVMGITKLKCWTSVYGGKIFFPVPDFLT